MFLFSSLVSGSLFLRLFAALLFIVGDKYLLSFRTDGVYREADSSRTMAFLRGVVMALIPFRILFRASITVSAALSLRILVLHFRLRSAHFWSRRLAFTAA